MKYTNGDTVDGEWGDKGAVWPDESPTWGGRIHGRIMIRRKSSGFSYEGDVWGGRYHGFGAIAFRNGDVYLGQWSNGVIHGNGTMEYHYGGRYEGGWKQGRRHGFGS